MIAQPLVDATTIRADQLTEGDIIRHLTGEAWKVICEPEYTNKGIRFEVLCLDLECPNNTQSLCFAPEWLFDLLDYQPVMAV
ncbi:hypothetical protein Cri9333_0552 [Crinalium epipsammum PCC 9333]|uniref:Uncharacterized protein n=1 Tax=Crinalium epipsammum PCC 9333 TaxID=1173022 RepID=K9VVH4_9CYAN|nr:hypothetical protein [Crinalium epipsammum]AFZ11502.1 hypothetical protein Cri9333_0552 [Crinalium epipsammum PCC 9333]